MKTLLDQILKRILPEDADFLTIAHDGKQDLIKHIPSRLKAWLEPDARFVIVHDQDSNDCRDLKTRIREVCESSGKNVLIRIAVIELEAWYWGDLQAVSLAYRKQIEHLGSKRKYREPDKIQNPKAELRKHIPDYNPMDGAKRIAEYMDIDGNTSNSFRVFVDGVRKLAV
jgi:hypothetical protein